MKKKNNGRSRERGHARARYHLYLNILCERSVIRFTIPTARDLSSSVLNKVS